MCMHTQYFLAYRCIVAKAMPTSLPKASHFSRYAWPEVINLLVPHHTTIDIIPCMLKGVSFLSAVNIGYAPSNTLEDKESR